MFEARAREKLRPFQTAARVQVCGGRSSNAHSTCVRGHAPLCNASTAQAVKQFVVWFYLHFQCFLNTFLKFFGFYKIVGRRPRRAFVGDMQHR